MHIQIFFDINLSWCLPMICFLVILWQPRLEYLSCIQNNLSLWNAPFPPLGVELLNCTCIRLTHNSTSVGWYFKRKQSGLSWTTLFIYLFLFFYLHVLRLVMHFLRFAIGFLQKLIYLRLKKKICWLALYMSTIGSIGRKKVFFNFIF